MNEPARDASPIKPGDLVTGYGTRRWPQEAVCFEEDPERRDYYLVTRPARPWRLAAWRLWWTHKPARPWLHLRTPAGRPPMKYGASSVLVAFATVGYVISAYATYAGYPSDPWMLRMSALFALAVAIYVRMGDRP